VWPRQPFTSEVSDEMPNHQLIAAGACLACAIGYTVTGKPLSAIATLVVLGLVNLAFILAR
jgi:hypothetical protein